MIKISGIRHSAWLPSGRERDAIIWCHDTFGPSDGLNDRWCALTYTIQFKEEEDRLFYLLRWGGN